MAYPSRIFSSYRALGYVSSDIPLVLRYTRRTKESVIITVTGKSFLTYEGRKLRLLSTSPPLPSDITCVACDAYCVYTGSDNVVHGWVRGSKIAHTYMGHEKPVHLLLPLDPHLLTVDRTSTLKMWDIRSEELYLELNFSNETFKITAITHPATYLNKVLIGSFQGEMQLWNLKTSKLIYTFKGWQSPVTVLEQAPAIDVMAVGLENGCIIIHNLKFDETLMKFAQSWGPITCLSFRTDGAPMLASGSSVGCIALWNLEDKVLHSQMPNAHQGAVAGMKFLQNEPLMVTNSIDNSIKIWIFDVSDGGGRQLRYRDGHSAPPTKIAFYGMNGENILSAGEDSTLKSFSIVNDMLHKNLGSAYYSRKAAKRAATKSDIVKMSPIVDFAAEAINEKDWDNIAACHRDMPLVTTWSYGLLKMGELKLSHTGGQQNNDVQSSDAIAKCVAVSACGNYVIIGFETGHVDKFNIQSGVYRGSYGDTKAHEKSVCGVATDALNLTTITFGTDKLTKFWNFKTRELTNVVQLDFIASRCFLHRESGLLAMSLEDFSLQLLDLDTKRWVRKFEGHDGRITSFDFRADARWLISASQDCTIRTWDIPAGRLIDCFLVEDVCTCLSMSPTGEFLATIHVDNLGVYLWINCTLYMHVSLSALPSDFEPQLQPLPGILVCHDIHADDGMDHLMDVEQVFKSPAQISDELVTLSLLPESRWKNLLVLDIIKKRNKPKEPPKAPKAAPFFLPTVSGLEFKFAVGDDTSKKTTSQILPSGSFNMRTEFSEQLESAQSDSEYIAAMNILKSLGPSAIDVEIRSLASEMGGSQSLLLQFMRMINNVLQTNRDFEVTQAYLGLFLKIHGNAIAADSELCDYAKTVLGNQTQTWERLQTIYGSCQCVVSFLKSAPL